GGTLSFAIPAEPVIRSIQGTSKHQEYRLSYYIRRIGLEGGSSTYSRYLIHDSEKLSDSLLNGEKYYKIPDMESEGFGANFIYVFNPERYSLAAAMDQSQMQERPGGSWVLMSGFRRQLLRGSGPFIPADNQEDFGEDAGITGVKSLSIAAGPG